MSNAGNALTHGTGVVTVQDTRLDYPFTINTFVSHTSIDYDVPWTTAVVPGDHPVSVRLKYDGRVTTWNGIVSVAGAVRCGARARTARDEGRVFPPTRRRRTPGSW